MSINMGKLGLRHQMMISFPVRPIPSFQNYNKPIGALFQATFIEVCTLYDKVRCDLQEVLGGLSGSPV
jgi:hypothetical protein